MGLLNKLFGKKARSSAGTKLKQTISGEAAAFDYAGFADLKSNKCYDRFFAGNLKLPTGKVVCTDPLYRELGLPQSWAVAPGDYPVFLYIATEGDFRGRVAYAELCFKDETPVAWQFSLIPEALLGSDAERKLNGMFPVEAGLGSFSDEETWKIYDKEIDDFYSANRDGNYYNDVLEALFRENMAIPPSSRGEDWLNYTPLHAYGNIIMFGSGWGDGLYPRYAGYDKNGTVIKLVVDFIQLGNE